ncbi:MAG TPA: PDZ domain-containing protein, partial [Thermodesulfobacteriaceae bacterium]|nr:PDZ domain-containing protein [Thermodesulfobacteriaceae bacterium]
EAVRFLEPLLETTVDPDVDAALDWFGLKLERDPGARQAERDGDPVKSGFGVIWDEDQPDLIVKSVLAGSSGAAAGILPRDELLAIGDERLTKDKLRSLMTAYQPGQKTTLLVARRGQIITLDIELEAAIPERFDISYIGPDNRPYRPIMIHRALLGSLERFFGVLIEHYAGAFPVWLSPVQAVVMTVADRHQEFAEMVYAKLAGAGFRVERDFRNEKLGFKIREAQVKKVPYMIIVGDKEVENSRITVRTRKGENLEFTIEEFAERLKEEIIQKIIW